MAESPHDRLYWRLDTAHHTEPVSRWASEVLVDQRTEATQQRFARSGVPLESIAWADIDGFVYAAVDPFGGDTWGPSGVREKTKDKLTGGFNRRIEKMREVNRSHHHQGVVDQWVAGGEQHLLDAGYRFLERDLFGLSDKELRKEFGKAREYVAVAIDHHVMLHLAAANEVGRVSLRLTRDHEFSAADLDALLSGPGGAPTGAAASAHHLVGLIVDAGAGDLLRQAGSLDELSAISPGVAGAVASHLAKWSRDAVRNDPAHPVIADEPLRLLDQLTAIADHIEPRSETGPIHIQALENRMLAGLGDTPLTRQRLERARRARPIISGSRTATIGIPLAVLRQFGTVIGVRLLGTGRLSDEEHVFDLTMDEVEALMKGSKHAPAESANLAAGRYARRRDPSGPPQDTLGDRPSPVSESGLPGDAVEYIESILWHLDHWLWPRSSASAGPSAP